MDFWTIRQEEKKQKKKTLAQGEFWVYFPAKRAGNFRDLGFWEKRLNSIFLQLEKNPLHTQSQAHSSSDSLSDQRQIFLLSCF